MEVAIFNTALKVPDSLVGETKVCDAGVFQFKTDLARIYGFKPDWENYFKIQENLDDFTLFFESGYDNPFVIIKRFKKGKTVDITPADYAKVNQKLAEVKALRERQKKASQQLQLRKGVADLILKGLTAQNLKFEVLKTGIEITVLDAAHKHHVSCLISNAGTINEPLVRMAYSHGKRIKVSELAELHQYAATQMQLALKLAEQVKNMLPEDWFC